MNSYSIIVRLILHFKGQNTLYFSFVTVFKNLIFRIGISYRVFIELQENMLYCEIVSTYYI